MLNKYDFKYILKKIIIAIVVIFVMSFINSCQVHAETYILDTYGMTSSYWVNNSNQYTMVWGDKYTVGTSLTNVRPSMQIFSPSSCTEYGCSTGIYNGNYLIDFYIMTDGGFNVNSCDDLSHNFQNIDMNSGNWVSNQLYGSCISTSKGYLDGHATLHILYSFELKAPTSYAQEFRFLVNRGTGFLSGSNWFKFYMGGVYDYDQQIINNIQNQALTNQIINQNQQIINGQQSIINSQNQNAQQAHQDSINEQNAINQNTQAQNDTNNILNNDDVSGASSEVDSLLQNNAFNDSSGIQSIINAPLNFINGLTNSCTPIQVTIPYIDTPLSIPCIKQELTNHVPSIVPILSTAINGFIIYRILIDIVYLIKSARNPDDDRIEVLDL